MIPDTRISDGLRRVYCTRRGFIGMGSAFCLATAIGCDRTARGSRRGTKAVVLGFDGMDPTLVNHYMQAGFMPNAARLTAAGGFSALRTSDPPQSPVAWANVITGTNPGSHGIYDFIARSPGDLQPYLSTSATDGDARTLKVGRWRLPLGGAKIRNLVQGQPFWNVLEDAGVPCTILRMPSNFPPLKSSAQTLSGLGTPDIQGAYGIFTLYTNRSGERTRNVSGGHIERVLFNGQRMSSVLFGPVNEIDTRFEYANVPFEVRLDATRPTARIRVQDADIILREGEWSEWVRLRFSLMPGLVATSGICRFFLKHARRPFELYVSPINVDPSDPFVPISTPTRYADDIASRIGPYYTQGMAEDISALSAGVFDDDAYRDQSGFVLDESLRMFESEFNRFKEGLFFYYFSTLDQNQHAFWRTIDPRHPLYSSDLADRHGDFIPDSYRRLDRVLGQVLDAVGPETLVMALSDHGFGSFRRQFNLNSWLLDNGYASPASHKRGEGVYFSDIDWGTTRAYGLGINSLYLNLRGREPDGCVRTGSEREALLTELAHRLERVVDPADGGRVIHRVYRPESIYSGSALDQAPDLIIGYNPGYRASWDTILGGYPREHVLDNLDAWSGDHCIDSTFMSGILLTNRPVIGENPALTDIAPTLLSAFNVRAPAAMQGRNVLHQGAMHV